MSRPTPDVPPLRDRLANERTALANERTLLAYVRTSLAFFAGGVALFQLVDEPWARVAGWAAIPVGAIVLVYGLWRFARVRRRLRG